MYSLFHAPNGRWSADQWWRTNGFLLECVVAALLLVLTCLFVVV